MKPSALRISAIARFTFAEAVHDRIFWNLLAFAVLVGGAGLVAGQISLGIERILLVQAGLTAMAWMGAGLAIFLAAGLVTQEVERRTLYPVLTRPVPRWEFLTGKFAGLVATLGINTALMAVALALMLGLQAHLLQLPSAVGGMLPLLLAVYFLLLQTVIIVAMAMLFSTFSSPLLAAVFAAAMFVIGNLMPEVREAARQASGMGQWVAWTAAMVLPDFSSLNLVGAAAHGEAIGLRLVALNTLYAVLYSAASLTGAVMIFEHRDLQ